MAPGCRGRLRRARVRSRAGGSCRGPRPRARGVRMGPWSGHGPGRGVLDGSCRDRYRRDPASVLPRHPLRAVPRRGATVVVRATGRRYRGMMEATGLPGAGGLRLVNELDVESYLRGMGEVRDPSWPPASLRAQAIAARTYALRAMASSG